MKEKMDKEIEQKKVKPSKGFSIKMIGLLDKMEPLKTENPIHKKLLVEENTATKPKEAVTDVPDKEVIIYLNICYSSR